MNKPLLSSKEKGAGLAMMMRTGLSLVVLFLMYFQVGIYDPGLLLPAGIVCIFGAFFVSYNISNRFKIWQFYADTFQVKNILGLSKKSYPWGRITAWQIRNRFGAQSGKEYIPNYTEVAFWVDHKLAFSFDDADYKNFEDLRRFFEAKMKDIGLECADYRE